MPKNKHKTANREIFITFAHYIVLLLA